MGHSKTEQAEAKNARTDFIRNHPELSVSQLAEIFGMTLTSVYHYMDHKNMKSHTPWTEEQKDFLTKHEDKPISWLNINMPGQKHGYGAIAAKRMSLEITAKKPNPWTDEEINFLKNHTNKDDKWISENMPEPQRSEVAIRNKRKKLNISFKKPKKGLYQTEELQFVEEHISEPTKWIVDNKPGPKRTINAINGMKRRVRAKNLTTRPKNLAWTQEELDFMESNMDMPAQWITDNKPGPKRTTGAIVARRMKIRKEDSASQPQVIAWTKEEIDFIKTNINKPTQ